MDPMQEIWNSVANTRPDGKQTVIFNNVNDLSLMYVSGFVDVQKVSFQTWIGAFSSSRRADGSYELTHPQWMDKKQYRYNGVIERPFDIHGLPEKVYTEEEFVTLLIEKVLPHTIFDASALPKLMTLFKTQKRLQDGKIKVDKAFKKVIAHFVDDNPSPLRILQVMVDAMKSKKGIGALQSHVNSQKSQFSAGKTAAEVAQARLAEMAGLLSPEITPVAKTPSVSLKDLQKKRRPSGRI